jgi:hypothetical protein
MMKNDEAFSPITDYRYTPLQAAEILNSRSAAVDFSDTFYPRLPKNKR